MTPSYLLTSNSMVALAEFIAPDTLFAFDLDGTLAPIVEEYSSANVSEPVRAVLVRLTSHARVAVITGRSSKDAQKILGFDPHLIIGNHGAEWPNEYSNTSLQFVQSSTAWQERLSELLAGVPGIEIEFKGESLSLHYRKATDQEGALALIDAAIEKLEPSPKRIGGKLVVNLVPMEAFTKGEALMAAMERFGAERAIYFGDDETDEEVFRLRSVDVFGVHIGSNSQTAASYYLNKQSELLGLLNSMVGMLETVCAKKNRA
ncbi:MAG: trehalose-phosphatase [Geobacter sp.]|nr:MAG: trehalose-phosphatase [Geobacter sp.]